MRRTTSSIGSMVLLGASGDLAGRLLLPALGELLEEESQRRDLVLHGRGRRGLGPGHLAGASSARPSRLTEVSERDDGVRAGAARRTPGPTSPTPTTSAADRGRPAGPGALLRAAAGRDGDRLHRTEEGRRCRPGPRLVLEKPFGTNAESAASLNELLAELVPEEQIHRVDHFLGRSSVLNLLGVRFANRLFEPLWSNEHIARVDITYDEVLALENRARYYDQAGALTDMIQSHLLQILALIAMDPPANVNAVDLRYAKATALRACRVWDDDPVAAGKRARYTAGVAHGVAGARLRRRARGRSGPQHRDARRAHGADRQLALGRRAVPAAVGQGAARTPQGGAGHLQAAAAPARRAARDRAAGPAAAHPGPGSDGRRDEREQPRRSVRAGARRPDPRPQPRPAAAVR